MWIFQPTFDKLIKEIKGSKKIFISAPWITPFRTEGLVKHLRKTCSLEIWIRMNPCETEKEEMIKVLDTLKYFDAIKICRNSNLHWKAYLCPDKGYIGSANFTERGLPNCIDDNSSIEALLRLTEKQLEESWKLKEKLSTKMQTFKGLNKAIEWWLKQRHKKVLKRYPGDAVDESKDDFPGKPSDFMR